MSASIVFSASKQLNKPIPLFGSGSGAGLVFRPGLTRIRCGKAVDSAGSCGRWCPTTDVNVPWSEAADKLCAWHPQNVGLQLQRLNTMHALYSRLDYNEMIIDAESWRDQLPGVIEAIYGDRGLHSRFLKEYGIDATQLPFLTINTMDWENPFSLANGELNEDADTEADEDEDGDEDADEDEDDDER